MRKFIALFLLVGLTAFALSTNSYSAPTPDVKGKWKVKGTTSTGKSYTGTVNYKDFWGMTFIYGRYELSDGEKLFSFWTEPKLNGRNLKFDFEISETVGLTRVLGNLNENLESNQIPVKANYTLSSDGHTFKGGWKSQGSGLSGKEVWSKDLGKITVTSVAPATLEVGSELDQVLTIEGSNFPDKFEIKPEDIAFLLDGKADKKISVSEILEVNDLGTTLKVRAKIAKDARPGKRDVKVKTGEGKELLTLEAAPKKLPLGGSVSASLGDTVRVYIPNSEGGTLTISGPSELKLHKGSEDGEEIKKSEDGDFEIESHGWYYVDLKSVEPGAPVELKAKYVIVGQTTEEKKPWNFWYFPFVESWSKGRNLYKDGEAYSKLDKVFGLKPEEDGWKKFDPTEHMDWWAPKRVRNKIFKEIYAANSDQDWNALNELREELLDLQKKMNGSSEEAREARKKFDEKVREYRKTLSKYRRNFKLEGLTEEMKKKYNPTTMQGYAWCYQRSKDSNKSWWGHCWGAVIASSLYKRPESAKTVEAANGDKVKFTQEELEGILTSYFTNHSVSPTNYMSDCPAGPPSEKLKEDVDKFCDDFFKGLLIGIKKNQLPLAINLRESRVTSDGGDQVWNHVAWKFTAEVKEVDGDETKVKLDLDLNYSKDIYPSSESSTGTKNYVFVLKYNRNGSIDRDNEEQNWISATAYAPSYLWRIERSSTPGGTDNVPMKNKIDKLTELFGFERIK